MYSSLPTTQRPAKEVLDEYRQKLVLGFVPPPAGLTAASIVHDMEQLIEWTTDSWGYLHPTAQSNGDRVWGCQTKAPNEPAVYEVLHVTNSQLEYLDYNVHHVLSQKGAGSIWLGVANNSARYDITDPTEALQCWAARFNLQKEIL